jgi:hypothetical protein
MRIKYLPVIVIFILFLIIGACSGDKDSAASSVESYIQALVNGNADRLSTYSCAAWETNAKDELASFAAVKVSLNNMQCQESGKDGDTTLVSCTGKITANYGNEVLDINLADRTYMAIFEKGEWRMCGYR